MSGPLSLQEPTLAWAQRAQADALPGLGWVDARAEAPVSPPSPDAAARFAGPPVTQHLPPSVQADAATAAEAGQVSAWEALALVMARAWWWVNSAEHLWSPYSPSREAQVRAVERFGVSAEHHQHDPARLARLMAALPRWAPTRGQLEGARLIAAALDEGASDGLDLAEPGDAAVICRSSQTWGARPPRIGQLQVRRGRVVTGELGPPRSDELRLSSGANPRLALRLLPVWTTLRLPCPPPTPPLPTPTAEQRPPRSDP